MRIRHLLPLVLVVASCAGTATTTTPVPQTTSTVKTTTTTAEPTTTAPTTTTVPLGEGVLPVALDQMPDTWVEAFFIPYGTTPDTLGTHLGGDGEGIWFGPEYGAQSPDGTWWFLDVANFRVAHFSEDGEFIDDVPVPETMLVNGVYFQYAFPKVMNDGTVLASRLGSEDTIFLRIREATRSTPTLGWVIDSFSVPVEMTPRADDGKVLYGFTFGEDSSLVSVDPSTETARPVDWFTTRNGQRFAVTAGADGLGVELPDLYPPATIQLDFEAGEIGGPAYVMVEVATSADGTMHLFLLGFPERDERLQLAGYLTISADGEVGQVEPMINPFSISDPGTPTRLGVRPGTSDVTFMYIGDDGVRVFTRR
jgi:hypothetical protein